MEDIINLGGGNLLIELYDSVGDDKFSDKPLEVKIDGVKRTVEPGGKVTLTPGESICLEKCMFHRFYGESGKRKVFVGEVSAVDDDSNDNCFYEPVVRFPEIIGDTNFDNVNIGGHRWWHLFMLRNYYQKTTTKLVFMVVQDMTIRLN